MTLFNVCMQFFNFDYGEYKAPSLKSLKARRAAHSLKVTMGNYVQQNPTWLSFIVARVLYLSFLQYCALWSRFLWIFEGLTL